MNKNHVRIFDTTLRDGEQSPGAAMTVEEKVLIAQKLEQLNVDVVEAGYPAASPGEAAAVKRIAEAVHRCQVAALCRTREGDIDAAWRAVGRSAHPLLHVFIATSDLHMEHKLQMTRRQVIEEIRRGVSACRSLCRHVEFSAEDATRSDISFLKEAVACAVENGASIVNIPDTVGYTMPEEYMKIIGEIRRVLGDGDAVVSVHCHNDLGLAVANSLAAVIAGARQVECCINGIGERAGNAALEEVVAALRVRPDLYGAGTRINAREITAASRLVSGITGMVVQPNKAVVGANAFSHASGIHQHGMIKNQRTYEIMRPEDFGLSETRLVLGKLSGRAALSQKLRSLGYELEDGQLNQVFAQFKALAEKKKTVYDEDLHALVASEIFSIPASCKLESIMFSSGSHSTPTATVTVRVNGESRTAGHSGDGPVNAAIEAVKKCTGRKDARLEEYHLKSITGGSDAQGQVRVTVVEGGVVTRGRATHTDVVIASANAFIDALNHGTYLKELNRLKKNGSANGGAP